MHVAVDSDRALRGLYGSVRLGEVDVAQPGFGIDRPDEGDVFVVGQRLNDLSEDELARASHYGARVRQQYRHLGGYPRVGDHTVVSE